jgi:hypothetical protein
MIAERSVLAQIAAIAAKAPKPDTKPVTHSPTLAQMPITHITALVGEHFSNDFFAKNKPP